MSLKVDSFLKPFRGTSSEDLDVFWQKFSVLAKIQKWSDDATMLELAMWRLRWTSQRIVAAFLFVGETTKAREKLRKLRQTKMEANYEAEQNLTKKALLLTKEVTKLQERFLTRKFKMDGSENSAPVNICQGRSVPEDNKTLGDP